MANPFKRTRRVLSHLWTRKPLRHLTVWSALAYALLYLWARGDIGFHPWRGEATITWAREPLSVLFKTRSAFYFEGIAIIDLPVLTWLFSPVNLAIGLGLGLLVGLNLASSFAALQVRSGGQSAMTVLASGLALITASACSAPVILVILGIQATAGLLAVFSALVPIAFVLLLATLTFNIARADPEKLGGGD